MINFLNPPIVNVVDIQSIASRLHALTSLKANAVLRQDSRLITAGDVFVAFSGDVHDGRTHIAQALIAGASAVLAEAEGLTEFIADLNTHTQQSQALDSNSTPCIIPVLGLKQALGFIADAYYKKPSTYLNCIGVTGTNGKTTVVNWLAQLLQVLHKHQQPCAVLGTLGAGLYGAAQPTGLTTPHASEVQHVLAQATVAGASSAAIEVTSIGLDEGRLNGVAFSVAAFTNLTQDHLDYHGTMAAYAAAKRQLFDCVHLKTAVINIDDNYGASWAADLAITRPELNCITTGFSEHAKLRASAIHTLPNAAQTFAVHYQGHKHDVLLPALGEFNLHNALTTLGCVIALGYDIAQAIKLLSNLQGVAGRMEIVAVQTTSPSRSRYPLVIVDFAHTPDGLSQALQALRPVATARNGALHVVFGCGGNRDTGKRPLMGAIAQKYANTITITNDNPRNEDPTIIAEHIASAAPKAKIQLDRATAIAQAITSAQPDDVVLLAGKGHETTQITAGKSLSFSDLAHATDALTQLMQCNQNQNQNQNHNQ